MTCPVAGSVLLGWEWGMSLNLTLLLLAVILMLIDFFFQTDIPTHIAYMILAFLIARNVDLHIMYRVIIGVCAWGAIVAFHYLVWRSVVQTVTNTLIAPDRYKSGADGLVGRAGTIEEIHGVKMLRVRGDFWACSNIEDFSDGDKVEVTAVADGVLTAKIQERSQ